MYTTVNATYMYMYMYNSLYMYTTVYATYMYMYISLARVHVARFMCWNANGHRAMHPLTLYIMVQTLYMNMYM